jgi:hypothetical protein
VQIPAKKKNGQVVVRAFLNARSLYSQPLQFGLPGEESDVQICQLICYDASVIIICCQNMPSFVSLFHALCHSQLLQIGQLIKQPYAHSRQLICAEIPIAGTRHQSQLFGQNTSATHPRHTIPTHMPRRLVSSSNSPTLKAVSRLLFRALRNLLLSKQACLPPGDTSR